MIKKIFIFYFICISVIFNAQILDRYPKGLEFYEGGRVAFYKQFHELLLEKKIQPCENKNEDYIVKVVVYPDSKIKLVKQDSLTISNSKCSYEITREVLKYMKGWKPAEIEGTQHAALVEIPIYVDDLFDKYTDSYLPEIYFTNPEFDGGLNEFRKKVANNIDLARFSTKGSVTFRLEVSFFVDPEGKIQDLQLSQKTDNNEFNNMVLQSVKSIKKKWKPATFHSIPVKSYFRLPLSFNFE